MNRPTTRPDTTHATTASYRPDTREAAKEATAFALEQIPEVGELLGTLLKIFWPRGDNSEWDSMRAEVEQLMDQKINDTVWSQTSSDLASMQKILQHDYLKDPPRQFMTTRSEFDGFLPQFQPAGFEVLLLPLWVQAANMQLGLLRDGVLNGQGWGFTDAQVKAVHQDLTEYVAEYTAYAWRWFGEGTAGRFDTTKVDYGKCEPFRTINAYHQEMTATVLDTVERWPMLDPDAGTVFTPDKLQLSSEVYTDPVGTAGDSGLFLLPWTRPAQPPTKITVWATGRGVCAVQLTYPDGGGPDGVTTTGRMGAPAPNGSATDVPVDPADPIAQVDVWAGDAVNGLRFTTRSGRQSPQLGGTNGTHSTFGFPNGGGDVSRPGARVLHSIHVNGYTEDTPYYADAVVFGFRYPVEASVDPAPTRARRR